MCWSGADSIAATFKPAAHGVAYNPATSQWIALPGAPVRDRGPGRGADRPPDDRLGRLGLGLLTGQGSHYRRVELTPLSPTAVGAHNRKAQRAPDLCEDWCRN